MRSRVFGTRGAVLAALALGCVSAVWSASFEGRWRLVEQRYETGSANMAAPDRPLRLEFSRRGAMLTGRIWAGDDPSTALAWPAFAADAGPLPVEAVDFREDAAKGEIRVSYRVRPSPADDLVLDVTEAYRVENDGGALTGTLTVKFTGGATNRGGFALHRRFEREP